MAKIQGGVVANVDIPFVGQRFESVEGMAGEQPLCPGLHEEAGLEDPKSRESQMRNRDFERQDVQRQTHQND